MKRTASIIILLLFTVLALAGCKPAEPVCAAQIADSGVYDNSCGMSVPLGATTAELLVQTKLKQGSMSWELQDPTGQVVWSGNASAEHPSSESRKLDHPLPGRWTLHIHLDKAVGEYTAPWIVR